MKLALLSDIHGNQYALSKVIDEIKLQNIDTLIVAGDTVGYYYGIKDVLKMLASFKVHFTKGNHEVMLEQLKQHPEIESELMEKYGSSLQRALRSLSELEIDQLLNVEHPKSITIENLKFLISHGAPWDLNQYLYTDSDKSIWDNFLNYKEDIFVVGHTQEIEYPYRTSKPVMIRLPFYRVLVIGKWSGQLEEETALSTALEMRVLTDEDFQEGWTPAAYEAGEEGSLHINS
jgi:predicted phosphodiesterase